MEKVKKMKMKMKKKKKRAIQILGFLNLITTKFICLLKSKERLEKNLRKTRTTTKPSRLQKGKEGKQIAKWTLSSILIQKNSLISSFS